MVLLVTVAPQQVTANAAPEPLHRTPQALEVVGEFPTPASRDKYTVTRRIIPVAPPRAALGPAVPASEAQQIAYSMLQARGWGDDQFSCLVALWNRESHWSTTAGNQSSGAYGIPQALPGSKMASAGPNWQTDAATQITWGLGYITGRYQNPCNAWAHSQATGWY